jgi:hypothetical protein
MTVLQSISGRYQGLCGPGEGGSGRSCNEPCVALIGIDQYLFEIAGFLVDNRPAFAVRGLSAKFAPRIRSIHRPTRVSVVSEITEDQ